MTTLRLRRPDHQVTTGVAEAWPVGTARWRAANTDRASQRLVREHHTDRRRLAFPAMLASDPPKGTQRLIALVWHMRTAWAEATAAFDHCLPSAAQNAAHWEFGTPA
mmetsp:Transcript_49380/g.128818  ORF Transcript_49380/g.128818 Transcript_49380/m.128818 type:complete len:107 (-) Transcript_49380:192-512(-)